ncbi:ion channel [Saccharopolyspora sp. K220]|uniref:ion channel n=1 Tax=Saccharopolyspora soli TaxID=2926618 RepID=UPI001F59B5C0|nr:ion channel [Saccharopolyspora soli]MCI2422788.1 ion channel [Saccharopolyspora soli]
MPGTVRRKVLINLATALAAVVLSTVGYYLLPIGRFGVAGTVNWVVAFAIGLAAVAALIVFQVRRFRTRDVRRSSSIAGVVAALYLAVLFFSTVYFGLAYHDPGSITVLRTKTDALYFALSITSTVGFGDVHAVSQLARAIAALHMAFNIGFLGAAVAIVRVRAKRPDGA